MIEDYIKEFYTSYFKSRFLLGRKTASEELEKFIKTGKETVYPHLIKGLKMLIQYSRYK